MKATMIQISTSIAQMDDNHGLDKITQCAKLGHLGHLLRIARLEFLNSYENLTAKLSFIKSD